MAEVRIHYADGSVRRCTTERGWKRHPDDGVQVVARMRPDLAGVPTPDLPLEVRRWCGVTDRELWTGTDTYDPFGWGEKRGSLIGDADYERIWREAAYG